MGRVRHLLAVAVLCTLLVSPAAASGLGALGQFGGTNLEPDGVFLRVDLDADGSASWAIDYRVRLDDENTTAAFESLRTDVESDRSAYTETFAARMRETAASAEDSTGRPMEIRNVTVSVERQQLPQEYGVVTYEFEWAGFAVRDGDRLRAGDALAGLFLDRETTLVVSWPATFTPVSVAPDPDERRENAVVWLGPTDFAAGEPAVTLTSSSTGTTATGGTGDGSGEDPVGEDDANGDSPSPLVLGLGVLVLVAVGAGVAVAWKRRGTETAQPRDTSDASGVSPAAGGGPASDTEPDDAAEPTTGPTPEEDGRGHDGRTTTAAAGTSATGADGSDSSDRSDNSDNSDNSDSPASGEGGDGERTDGTADTDETASETVEAPWTDELLSNEERVTVLLEHEGGRMKQQAIASELEWSDAKTSQVIGKMREDDAVETFRLGRENVVSLPDDDVR